MLSSGLCGKATKFSHIVVFTASGSIWANQHVYGYSENEVMHMASYSVSYNYNPGGLELNSYHLIYYAQWTFNVLVNEC